jgi:hypothetical protein
MDKAKIRLSEKEAELVANADWILTKNQIMQKARYLLEDLQSRQTELLQSSSPLLPAEVLSISPKVSRGENYQGLPYLVLDQPRYFGQNDQFAIRTMFWWGNFFSITLHLSGRYKKMFEGKLIANLDELKKHSFFIGVNEHPWEHHFEASNYLPLLEATGVEFTATVSGKDFIKIAKRVSLKQWEDAGDMLLTSFGQLIDWLTR